jgi:hypothetical protein
MGSLWALQLEMETVYFEAFVHLLDLSSFRMTCDCAVIQREIAKCVRGVGWGNGMCGGSMIAITEIYI